MIINIIVEKNLVILKLCLVNLSITLIDRGSQK